MPEYDGESALRELGDFLNLHRRFEFDIAKVAAAGDIKLLTARAGQLLLTQFSTDLDFDFATDVLSDCVHFQFVEAGAIEYAHKSGSILGNARGGDLLTSLMRAGDRLSVRARGLRIGLAIEHDRLREVAARHFDILPPRSIVFRGNTPSTSGVLQELRRVVGALLSSHVPGEHELPNVRTMYETAAVVALLLGVPSNISDTLERSENEVSPAYVLRAQEFMKTHLEDPIAVEEIAGAARCTPRNLQLTFRRVLGMSPMRYLRKMRLDEAQRRLLAGDGESLTSIAMSLGFTNLGRFSKDYKTAFGELPSRLRRVTVQGFRPEAKLEQKPKREATPAEGSSPGNARRMNLPAPPD